MKKLFTIAILLLATMSAFAQGGRIRVFNNTNCVVYYQLIVSGVSLTPICTPASISSIISIAPGTNVTYSGSGTGSVAIPGISAIPVWILGGRVLDGPPACISTSIIVGEPCVPYTALGVINVKTATCIPCSTIKATWTPASPAGATSTLTFS